MQRILSKTPYFIFLAMTFLIPVFFLPISSISPQFGTSLLFAFATLFAVVVYIIYGLVSGSLDLPNPARYVVGFTVIVPIIYFLSAIANGFSRLSFFGYTFDIGTVGFIILGFAYMFIVSLLFRDKTAIFYSYFVFVLSSIILAIFVALRLKLGAGFLSFGIFTDITSTPVGSFNNLGILFGIGGILSLITYQMVSVSRFMKVVLTIALLLSLFFLALVNFTAVWIILGVCAFLFILYSMFSGNSLMPMTFVQRLFKVPLYPVIVLVISAVFVIWSGSLGTYLSNTLKAANVEVRPDLSSTMSIALSTIKAKPFFGSGPNTFVNQWLAYRPDAITSGIFWNTDFNSGIGLIPTFAVTTGLLGVLSWLLFLGFYVYLGIKSIFVRIEDTFVRYLLVSSFFVSLYLWIMTFVYVPSTVIFILTFFFTGLFFSSVYLAGIIKVEKKFFSVSPRAGFISSLIFVAAFVASLFLGYGLWKNSESLWYFQKSSYAINQNGDITTSENYMLKAIAAVPNDIYFRALSQIEVLKLNAIASQDTTKVSPADIQKQFSDTLSNAIKAGLAAKDIDQNNYLNWIALGQVYDAVSAPALKIDGAYDSAKFAYNQALSKNPKNPSILLLLSRLSVTHGDLKQAENYANQAVQEKSNYLDAYFLLSQIQVSEQNIQAAINSVTSATVIDPTNPATFFQLGLLKYDIKDYYGAIAVLEHATTMTPDYANAKYFLGLSYEAVGRHDDAIKQFEDLKVTNPDSQEVNTILENLKAGKSIFTDTTNKKPEKGTKLPVTEKVQ